MSRFDLFTIKKPKTKASGNRKSRRLGRNVQGLEDRRMMAGDVATAEPMPLESEYVETSTIDPAAANWTLDPIADLEATSGQTLETMLTVSGEIETGALVFSASIVSTIEQQLDAQYDLVESDDYHTNCLGNNERWIRSANGGWFYVMPSGEFYQWQGSFATSTLLADFDSTHYDNPDLIAEPETIDASVYVDGDVLVITPDADYTGSFQVEIGATDGANVASQTVMVAVAESIPEDNGTPEDPTANEPMPVLMVIANQDFYYQEYGDTRQSIEAAGLEVVVAAATTEVARPHANSGEGSDGGLVTPDLALTDVDANDYSAIIFVGGWGASSYQYAFEGTYNHGVYNSTDALKSTVNDLVNDFVAQDKYVAAICHGVSVLAYARVDGQSLLEGKTVSAWAGSAPSSDQPIYTTRQNIELNGGTMVESGSVGDPTTVQDDVIIDGRIITAENYDAAAMFGQVISELVSDSEYVDAVFAEWE